MDLTLPLDYSAIERILPHRYPFLLVDRITEFEPDKRIVGIKNVTLNERYLARSTDDPPVLPPTILTEAVAQVGAIMILAKPENREKLIYFMGIERVRYRRPVHAGDVVEIEATRIVGGRLVFEIPPDLARGGVDVGVDQQRRGRDWIALPTAHDDAVLGLDTADLHDRHIPNPNPVRGRW